MSTSPHPGTIAASVSADENATTAPAGARDARPAREVAGEHRPREHDVGHRAAERVGDDRGLDAARERRAVAVVVAQLEPTGVAHRGGEPLAAGGVVEVGDGRGTELAGELPGRAPELRLLGRVPRIHRK